MFLNVAVAAVSPVSQKYLLTADEAAETAAAVAAASVVVAAALIRELSKQGLPCSLEHLQSRRQA